MLQLGGEMKSRIAHGQTKVTPPAGLRDTTCDLMIYVKPVSERKKQKIESRSVHCI